MKIDPIVEEVREARKQVEAEATSTRLALRDYLRLQQQTVASRLVKRSPQHIQKRKTTRVKEVPHALGRQPHGHHTPHLRVQVAPRLLGSLDWPA